MKKYIVDFLIVAIPVLLIIAGVNYFGDPAHKFDNDYEQRIVDILVTNHHAANVDNCSERRIKNLFIEAKAGMHYDWAVYGSSRCMTLSSIETGTNLINLGVSSATIMDFVAIDYLSKQKNLAFDNLIIVLDPYYLCDEKQNYRWKENSALFYEARGLSGKQEDTGESIWVIFSPTYFQSSLKSLLLGKKRLAITNTVNNEGQTTMYDGSISYAARIRNKDQAEIDYYAARNQSDVYDGYLEISDSLSTLFEELIQDLQKRGVNIFLYEAPLHPAVYEKVKEIKGIKKQHQYFEKLCEKYNIPLLGSYNPTDEGCDNRSFYDADHMRREVINETVKEKIIDRHGETQNH